MTGLVSKKILKDYSLRNDPGKIDDFWKLLKYFSSLKNNKVIHTKSIKQVTSKYKTRNKSIMGSSVEPSRKNGKVEREVIMQGYRVG